MRGPYVRHKNRVILVSPPRRDYTWACVQTYGTVVRCYHHSEEACREHAAQLHKATALQIFWPIPDKVKNGKIHLEWRK